MSERVIILRGDAACLPLADESVDLIVTSPPYWNLRSYTDGGEHYAGQIGSEPTPGEYIAALMRCTREWKRVLKPSGSIFVDLGDKYSDRGHGPNRGNGTGRGPQATSLPQTRGPLEKSLLLLPERYRVGCVDELGLIARAVIEWSKPNGLPESVTDRVRRSHEDIVHFTKQPRYFAAVDEIREPHAYPNDRRGESWRRLVIGATDHHSRSDPNPLGKLPGSVWEIASAPLAVPPELGVSHFAAYPPELVRRIVLGWSPSGICTGCGEGRRPVVRSSRLSTEGERLAAARGTGAPAYAGTVQNGRPGAELGKRNALSGPELARHTVPPSITGYACACTPFTDHPERRGKDFHAGTDRAVNGMNDGNGGERYRRYMEELANPRGPVREYHLDGWTPPPARPAVVVDPFGGTGTSALVASVLGRTGITVDRSADYCRLARWRTSDPAERARALSVPKPPKQVDGQGSLFDGLEDGGAA
jgi:DNA modification methylase